MHVVSVIARAAMILTTAASLLGGCSRDSEIRELDARVHALFEEKRYDEAAREAEKLLEASEKRFGKESPDLVPALVSLGGLYRMTERAPRAVPLYERLVRICEKAKGPEHPETLKQMQELATVYMAGRRYDKVEDLIRRIAEAREKDPDATDLQAATAWNNLGYFYLVQKRYAEAEPLFLKSIERLEKKPEELGDFIDVTLSHLAYTYRARGRSDDSLRTLQKIADARKKRLGPTAPELGSVFNNMGLILKEKGLPEEAEGRYRQAVAVFEKNPTHAKELAATLQSLAALLSETGKEEEAAKARARLQDLGATPSTVNQSKTHEPLKSP